MPRVRTGITMSIDGYVAGPNQSADNPLGEDEVALHEWPSTCTRMPRDRRFDAMDENAR